MKNYLAFFLSALFVCSCQSDYFIENYQDHDSPITNEVPNDKETLKDILSSKATIGKKLENPYSILNLKRAAVLYETRSNTALPEDYLTPTHHYIVFRPECHEHYKAVTHNSRLNLLLYQYPLDHEVSDGWLELDPRPEFSTNGFQHRWGYVPVDMDISDINCPYEILYDIVDIQEIVTTRCDNYDIYIELENISHELCNIPVNNIPITKATAVTPSGKITFYNSSLDKNIGCYGMCVKARRLAKNSYGYCDEDGYFVCDKSFLYKWEYVINFGRDDFEIRKNTTEDMVAIKLSHYHGPLNLWMSPTNSAVDHIFYCEILRAACKYFYGEIDGLNRPPLASELKDRIYFQAILGEDTDNHWNGFFQPYTTLNSIPYIRIYRDNDTRRSSAAIYWTTIHELAHASHWKHNVDEFLASTSKVKESYACGIAWHLTRKVHPDFERSYDSTYTGIVQDLIDSDGKKGYSESESEDVYGFTIQEIESSVYGAKTWSEWENNIINMYPYNPTVSNVSNLFGIW